MQFVQDAQINLQIHPPTVDGAFRKSEILPVHEALCRFLTSDCPGESKKKKNLTLKTDVQVFVYQI